MPKCKNDKARNYTGTEPSPKGLGWCAHADKEGKRRKGKDGIMYIVVKRASGSLYWKKATAGKGKISGAKKIAAKKTIKKTTKPKSVRFKVKRAGKIPPKERIGIAKTKGVPDEEFTIKPVAPELVRKLNKHAECTGKQVNWASLERKHPTLKTIRGRITNELAAIGVYMFIVPNDSGWGDAPDEEVNRAFAKVIKKKKSIRFDMFDYPCIIGNLKINPENNLPIFNDIYCSHANITDDKYLKQQVIDIFTHAIGKAFIWNGSKVRAIQLKI
jgi:hypothetical protein